MKRFRQLFVCFVALLFTAIASGQTSVAAGRNNKAKESFERAVPATDRRSFCSVLERGTSSALGEDWAGFYDVLLPERRGEQTKQEFTQAREKRSAIPGGEFVVAEVKAIRKPDATDGTAAWSVVGCTIFRGSVPAEIKVYLLNGRWFVDYLQETIVIHGLNECPHLKNTASLEALCKGTER